MAVRVVVKLTLIVKVNQVQDVQSSEFLSRLSFSGVYQRLEIWLDNLGVEFLNDLLSDFIVFDEHQNEVLSSLRACLGACEEEREALINDHSVVSAEVLVFN